MSFLDYPWPYEQRASCPLGVDITGQPCPKPDGQLTAFRGWRWRRSKCPRKSSHNDFSGPAPEQVLKKLSGVYVAYGDHGWIKSSMLHVLKNINWMKLKHQYLLTKAICTNFSSPHSNKKWVAFEVTHALHKETEHSIITMESMRLFACSMTVFSLPMKVIFKFTRDEGVRKLKYDTISLG